MTRTKVSRVQELPFSDSDFTGFATVFQAGINLMMLQGEHLPEKVDWDQ
jgi:hypothetical protein